MAKISYNQGLGLAAATIVALLVATGMIFGSGLLTAATLAVIGAAAGVSLNALGRRHKQRAAHP